MSMSRNLLLLSRHVTSARMTNSVSVFRRPFMISTAKPASVLSYSALGKDRRQHTISCGCCGPARSYQASGKRNATGDKQLLEFLNEEIREEAKAHSGNLPTIEGFEASSDEAVITLTKKKGNETITVKFNVNNSIEMDEPYGEEVEQEKQEDQPSSTISIPSFTVEISKGGPFKLALRCSMQESEGEHEETAEGEDAVGDAFEIEEMAIYEKEWNEKTYTVQASFMDGALYDLLIQMLEERGINEKFTNQLVAFSTNYEHGSYIRFLESLREFVKTK